MNKKTANEVALSQDIDVEKVKLYLETMKIRLHFTQDLLASLPANEDIYNDYVGSTNPDKPSKGEEYKALGLDGVVDKGKTVFARDENNNPCIVGYQVRGFLKNACKCLKAIPGTYSEDISASKQVVDRYVTVKERLIPVHFEGEISDCQRPLRASTPQGDRVALAISEAIPAHAWCEFTIVTPYPGFMDVVREWLEYGAINGLGQWRNSGKGSFTWEELDFKVFNNLPKKKKSFKIGKKMNDDK